MNTITSLIYEVITVVCAFILPRLILSSYGSEVNGLISSITQFLGFITLLQMGVGAVVESSLYEPLANHNLNAVSKIISSARKFFYKIALILFCYVVVLCVVYPYISDTSFDWIYVSALIVIISIGSFSQYVFGIVDRLLLTSDQKGYIVYISTILSTLLNTIVCAVMIYAGATIHAVKLASALIFLAGPVIIHIYIRKNYPLDVHIHYDEEPIKQKWNGIAQHIAAVVLDGTDVAVLTAFSTLENVSIYAVYNMVIGGIKRLTMALTNGIQALMGEMLAKKESEALVTLFSWTEWFIHTLTVFIFGCCSVLIVPFVKVYTNEIVDADYIQPLFGLLLTLANAGHCLRLPYNLLILAGGHYKQTQSCHIIAATLNLVISVLAVKHFGLIGVTVGTLVAMVYQSIWMAVYVSKNLIDYPMRNTIKQFLVDIICFTICFLVTMRIPFGGRSFLQWIVLAVVDAVIWLLIIAIANGLFYKDNVKALVNKVMKKQ